MTNGIEIHLHFHEGVSPEVVVAAVEAAKQSNGSSALEAAEPEPQPEPSGDERRNLIERAFTESQDDGSMRPLLLFLASQPERKVPYTKISEHLGYDTARSLPGLLGAFGRRSQHRYNGFKPFSAIWENDSW